MLKKIGQEVAKGLIAVAVLALIIGLIALASLLSGVVAWFMETWTTGVVYFIITIALTTVAGCIWGAISDRHQKSNEEDAGKRQIKP